MTFTEKEIIALDATLQKVLREMKAENPEDTLLPDLQTAYWKIRAKFQRNLAEFFNQQKK